MFKTNSTAFDKATQGVPAEKWLEQPGEDSNHLTWIVGHAVVHRALAAKILGSEWSAPWENLFARGAKRVSPEQYPDAQELQRAWREVSEKLNAALPSPQISFPRPLRRDGRHSTPRWVERSRCCVFTKHFTWAK